MSVVSSSFYTFYTSNPPICQQCLPSQCFYAPSAHLPRVSSYLFYSFCTLERTAGGASSLNWPFQYG